MSKAVCAGKGKCSGRGGYCAGHDLMVKARQRKEATRGSKRVDHRETDLERTRHIVREAIRAEILRRSSFRGLAVW